LNQVAKRETVKRPNKLFCNLRAGSANGAATYRMPLRTLSAGEQSNASVHDSWRYGRLSINQPESAIPRSLADGASRDSRPLSRSMFSRTPVPPALRDHEHGHTHRFSSQHRPK